MHSSLISLVVLASAVSCVYYDYPDVWNRVPADPIPSCELGNQLRYIPMFVVPDRQLTILQDYRTRYYTPAPALVQFIGQEQVVPAVRVVLDRPIHLKSWQSFIEFPSSFTIVQDGYRLPFPVSAVYAPLSEYQYVRRPYIDVVYAVPSMPTPAPKPTTTTPRPHIQNVTVLNFPEAIAQPQVLFHVEEDDELGGRNPPVPIIPAGIVQSSAPTADITTFVNSKESPILQALREQTANRLKLVRI